MNESVVTVQVRHRFEASAERVFDAWLDPEKARRFLFATPTGEMVRVDIDARVGGKFNITERRDGEDAEHVGEYLEIERPRRLVFNFGDNVALPVSKVTIEIVAPGSGCELTLTHERIPAEYETQTAEGWAGVLEGLEAAIA